MPLQRRLPKVGFRSRKAGQTAEVRLGEIAKVEAEIVDLEALQAAGIVSARAKRGKVILSGEISRAVKLKGLSVTKGARAAIEAAGGEILELEA
jgi:large subunit ribosomal protein L15